MVKFWNFWREIYLEKDPREKAALKVLHFKLMHKVFKQI